MAEEHKLATEGEVEVSDRGLFGFGKKEEKKEEEKKEEEVLATGVEKIKLDEREEEKTGVEKINLDEGEEEKKHGILGQFHRSHSSSSSSSDEEEGEGENKVKKKKKNVLNEITEKFHKDGEEKNPEEVLKEIGEEKKAEEPTAAEVVEAPAVRDEDSTAVVVEKLEDATVVETTAPEGEKKGFLDKIKEKLPGHGKKTPEDLTVTAPLPEKDDHIAKEEVGEKKGFLEKIKEKLPGYSPKSGVEESEKTNVDH